jgi:ATP-binding cassette subfamily C protein
LLVDALQGIKAIKAMGEEQQFLRILEGETQALNASQRRRIMAAETLRLTQEPVVTVMLGLGLYVMLVMRGMSFATVAAITFLFYRLIRELNSVQTSYQLMAAGEAAFWSLSEQIAHAQGAAEEEAAGGVAPTLRRELRFDAVDFRYGDQPVLQGLSLRVPAGAFVALIGPSGAGKTTIVDLMVRLQQPHAGSIFVDDVPLDQVDLRAWRDAIGYVPQEMLLFNGTILDNITLGDRRISRAQVEEALRGAGALEFVRDRPGGLESLVGNQGVMLSGGQRQRLAIARALVRRPKLLILDEVTAALDPVNEAAICETLALLKRETTIVAVSHQAALRNVADIVYALENGTARLLRSDAAPVGAG